MILAIYSRIWSLVVTLYKFKKHYNMILEYWRVVYGPKEHWEFRFNDSAIVSCYRYSEWSYLKGCLNYWFAWQFVEPLNLRKVELLYRGKSIRTIQYNHHFHPGEYFKFEWHF